MKLLRNIYLLAMMLMLSMVGCTNDDGQEIERNLSENGIVRVHLSMSQLSETSIMRGASEWEDHANATDDEMMNVWTVVAVKDADNTVQKIYACKPSGKPDQEVDDLVELPAGGVKYRFYSFANIAPEKVGELLGITGVDVSGFASQPVNEPCELSFTSGATVTKAAADAVTVRVNGNNFNPTTADNGFGAKGIPMSNVQTMTVEDDQNVDLVVVRMLAKVELLLYNDKSEDVTVTSITLTDVTENADDNLKLLPELTNRNTMEVPLHGDIQPRLGSPTQSDLVLAMNQTVAKVTNSTTGTPVKIAFYVNESGEPNNDFKHFFLKIQLDGESEERYVLIDDVNSSGAAENWKYIARNDYRVIPIVLDDYKLDIIPFDFPPIGVMPASVKEEDGLYTVTFHDYGHFHLVPRVTHISDGTPVDFLASSPSAPYASTSWGLAGTWATAWGSWTDATKETPATDDGSFYRSGSTATVDASENGGFPVLDTETTWNGYHPFIFGYIEDPGSLAADKKVYHEFSIYLYKQGMSAPRQMTYRLYMILDEDQMMYMSRRMQPHRPHNH